MEATNVVPRASDSTHKDGCRCIELRGGISNKNGLLIQEVEIPEVEYKRLVFNFHQCWEKANLNEKMWRLMMRKIGKLSLETIIIVSNLVFKWRKAEEWVRYLKFLNLGDLDRFLDDNKKGNHKQILKVIFLYIY